MHDVVRSNLSTTKKLPSEFPFRSGGDFNRRQRLLLPSSQSIEGIEMNFGATVHMFKNQTTLPKNHLWQVRSLKLLFPPASTTQSTNTEISLRNTKLENLQHLRNRNLWLFGQIFYWQEEVGGGEDGALARLDLPPMDAQPAPAVGQGLGPGGFELLHIRFHFHFFTGFSARLLFPDSRSVLAMTRTLRLTGWAWERDRVKTEPGCWTWSWVSWPWASN